MNDVKALAPGQWQWNGLLTPKGRVIALFALLREADEQFLMVLPDFDAAGMAARLRRFVFRSKLDLEALDDWRACAGPAPATDGLALATGDTGEGWGLDLSGSGASRGLWLLPGTSPVIAAEDPASTLAWCAADLAHGLPRLPTDQREAWTPQMLSLSRLTAYSLKKGCYPGQEIVSRTHYLGQAKRVLARFQAQTCPEPGSPVLGPDGQELGPVICAGGGEVLAVLPAEPGPGPFHARDCALVPAPLLAGLAR